MSSPKPKILSSLPRPQLDAARPAAETISVSRADIYRLAAESMTDHRTVCAFLTGQKVHASTDAAIRRAASKLKIRLNGESR